MTSPNIQSHREKTKNLAALCKEAADFPDLRVQGYLSKYLIIMASSYIEVSLKEVILKYCENKSNKILRVFVTSAIAYENSLNCNKIESILNKFDKKIWSVLNSSMTEEQRTSIDSLKALRDQIAHGKDNNTGYIVINRYFDSVVDFPDKLVKAFDAI
jgi:hypothetical protein